MAEKAPGFQEVIYITKARTFLVRAFRFIAGVPAVLSVYDNPVFTIKVDASEAKEWAVKGAELVYAPTAGDAETAGTLAVGEGWGAMPVGTWVLSINMETLTYEFASAFEMFKKFKEMVEKATYKHKS